MSHGLSEYEPEGELAGQRVCGKFFQNAEEGVGNVGRQAFRGGGQAIGFMYGEAYYNRIRIYSALDNVVPDMFNSGRVA
jgi:hypothetical protein